MLTFVLPIVTVPLRSTPPFAVTLTSTVPEPVPLLPSVIFRKSAVEAAVHPHPAAAVTAIDTVAESALMVFVS
jgi:hypothetical protein